MAVVVGPLLSADASGKFGDTLEFKCGSTVAGVKKSNPGLGNGAFNEQQNKFKSGIAVWKSLTNPQKQEWRGTGWWLEGKLEQHGQSAWIDGYQAFMSYYLRYGSNGWAGYPAPS